MAGFSASLQPPDTNVTLYIGWPIHHNTDVSILNKAPVNAIQSTSVAGSSQLRSVEANNELLFVPQSFTASFEPRSFGISGPGAWNEMPAHMRNLTYNSTNSNNFHKLRCFTLLLV